MSALVGLMRRDGAPGRPDDLRRMAHGTAVSDAYNSASWQFCGDSGPASLGWSPAAFTPEDGYDQQPLFAEGLMMVADARLDNRAELCVALGIPQVEGRFSDSALLFRAYQEWGEDTPRRLLGDFAFVVWDVRKSTLFCARDHRGKRPLFYHSAPHVFAVASSPRALLALPHVPRRLNEPALADYMAFMGSPSSTMFEGILRVPPAHTLTVTAGRVRLREFWRMRSQPVLHFRSDEECLDVFRELFVQAVGCRLRSTGPVGAFLSGGLDSSSVACTAARLLEPRGERLSAFTAVPMEGFKGLENPGEYNDETPFVEAIRAMYHNLDVTYIRTGGQSILADLDRSFELFGFPIANPPNRLWIEAIHRRAVAGGIRVLLHGGEGNLWMSHKGVHGENWLKSASMAATSVQSRVFAFVSRLKARIAPLLPGEVWRRYRHLRVGDAPWRTHSPMRTDFAVEMRVRERYLSWPLGLHSRPVRSSAPRRIGHATSTLLNFENDLHSAVRLHLHVDMRDPTADKRLIEFCLALPEHQYARANQNRLIVRRGMHGILPPQVLWNQQRGVQAADWLVGLRSVRHEISAELARLERTETAARCLDLPRMRRALHAWPDTADTPSQPLTDELEVLARGITIGRFIRWFEGN